MVRRVDTASGCEVVLDPEREVMLAGPGTPRAGRTLGVGIIGAGAIAQRSHIPNYRKAQGVEVVAVCDPVEEKARLVAETWGIACHCRSHKDILAMESVDLVSVCTPNYLHAPITIEACEAGKHVLCEKPIATTLEDAREMMNAARRNRVKLGIAQFKTFVPTYEVARQVLDDGLLGEVRAVRTKIGHAGPEGWSPTGEWFRRKKEAGMGVLLDLGTKQISLLRWLLRDEVECVAGMIGGLEKQSSEVEDHASGVLRFKSGTICVFEASWCTSPSFKGIEVTGSKGTMFIDYPGTRLEVRLAGALNAVITPEVPEESRKGDPFQRFVDCIREDGTPDITAEDETLSLAVAMALYESSRTGRLVTVDSLREK